MGEKYLLNIYSLLNKKFLSLESANLFTDEIKFDNYEIINVLEDKIMLKAPEKNTVYIIEIKDNSDFYLLKQSFKYFSNIVANDKYLLFDEKNENNLNFSLIDLSNFSKKEKSKIIQLLKIEIDNNPKIIANQKFKKMVQIYDNNQLCIMDYNYEEENTEIINVENKENIMKINLSKDNEKEIEPSSIEHSSIYNNDSHPKYLFKKEKKYFCSKSNSKVYLIFHFKPNYYFLGFKMIFWESYKESRPKKFNVSILDIKKRVIKKFNFTNDKKENKEYEGKLNCKGATLRIDFLENFKESYFTIERMYIYADVTYSLK